MLCKGYEDGRYPLRISVRFRSDTYPPWNDAMTVHGKITYYRTFDHSMRMYAINNNRRPITRKSGVPNLRWITPNRLIRVLALGAQRLRQRGDSDALLR